MIIKQLHSFIFKYKLYSVAKNVTATPFKTINKTNAHLGNINKRVLIVRRLFVQCVSVPPPSHKFPL